MSRISALIVARNEAERLPDLLASLEPADEIVVVLDRSTDSSLAIAWKRAHRVIEGAWATEGERRNAGLEACSGDWVLEVEPDERVPAELWPEIRRVAETSTHAWHRLRIDNHVGDRLIRRGWVGRMGAAEKPVLSRQGAKRWRAGGRSAGAEWGGAEGPPILVAGLHRVVDQDVSGLLRRLDRETDAEAADRLAAGRTGTLPGALAGSLRGSFGSYFRHGGWREGGWGVLLAVCAGMVPVLSHLKARLEPERYGNPDA
ncbi:glycosyltransferase [Pararoseomonas indoligenes]|uniref:Glycosyltransferase n=1 Tax=Roseomonas indoligenes TaxID=2820811 RepID=A0A940S3X8_9PROT|nr:glycosyltransferase [Pararoseomonas indoligenes]MBP0491399.1 glycosyltransferase [Pararoseomonas indoligenes]